MVACASRRAAAFLALAVTVAVAVECNGDSCPATNLAPPPAAECTGDSCPATNLAPPPEVEKPAPAAAVAAEPAGVTTAKMPKPRMPTAAAGPHVVVVHDSATVKLEAVLGVFTKLGVTDQKQAMQAIKVINQKGSSVVVEGSEQACQQVAALFEAIEMRTDVRPKRPSDTPSEYSDSDVLTLDAAGLNEMMQSETPMLVTFYAPWCGHCRQMVPEFKKAATRLKASGIATAAVNCDQEKGLAQQLKIKGFPTVKFVYKGQMSDFAGPRQAAELVGFAQGQAAIAKLKAQTLKLVGGVAGGVKRAAGAVSKLARSKVLQRQVAAAAA